MPNQLDQAVAGEPTPFKAWALAVGCLYASVTLCVVGMAVARVTAAPQAVSGYAAPVGLAVAPERLVGDFWPAGASLPLSFANIGA
jgi:hypothetical protein